jgi:bifunctional DNA-binding transcriptional regulator/antitoxin component of YhaV-PrlF toxin-antitoxin module
VVLPIEFRKKLGVERNSKVLISMDEETVFINASDIRCPVCKKQGEINSELGLCIDCIERIKKYNT